MDGLKTKEDRRFQTFWVIFFILISVIAIIPVLRVISISFSGRDAINKGQVFIFPIGFNVDAYAKALKSGTFVSSFGYSIILMAVVTAVDMIMTKGFKDCQSVLRYHHVFKPWYNPELLKY